MKILSCYINNFGILSDREFVFNDGLNEICEDNGWGKSTLTSFIRVMLYGFENEAAKIKAGRERYAFKPWQGKSLEEQQEYFRYALDFVTERFGQENMLSAVVHMDETTPHMHFTFVPITKDGKLSSKSIIGGPKGMVQMQDDFYAYIVKKYPEISRGLPAKVTHRSHIPPYLFKNATTLYEHYNEICAAIQDIGMIGNAKKKDAALALLGRYAPEMSKMSEQLKITDKKVADLERSLQNKDSSISYYRAQNTEQAQEIDNLSDKLYELHRMQEELQRQIDLVPPDLLKQLEEEEKQRRREERKLKERERGGAR